MQQNQSTMLLWIGTISAAVGGLAVLIGLIIGNQRPMPNASVEEGLRSLMGLPFLVFGGYLLMGGPCRRGSPLRSEAPCLCSDRQISGSPATNPTYASWSEGADMSKTALKELAMKSLSAIVAAAFLVLTLADAIALLVLRYIGADLADLLLICELHFVLIPLTVIFAASSAVASPQAPLTRAVFCGLTFLVGLFSLLVAPQFLVVGPQFLVDYGLVGRDYVSYWLAICVAGIAILNVLPSVLARRAALLYGAYGLVIALCLANLYLTFLVGDRAFLIGFQPPDGDLLNGTVAPAQ
jgi:hypothetical protein